MWTARLGNLLSSVISQLLLASVFIGFPFGGVISAHGASTWIVWAYMGTLITIRAAMGSTQGTSINLLINNSATTTNRGSINGFSQSVSCAARSVAPLLIGAIYSSSLEWTSFPGHAWCAYIVISAAFITGTFVVYQLPASLNTPKKT
jgi:hypothetical protein